MTDSPEYTTLVQCNQKLRTAIQSDVASIGTALLAAGLINSDLHSHMVDSSRNGSERAARLVHYITSGVELDSKSYWTFVKVLSQEPQFVDILHILNETYSSNIAGSTVPIDELRQQHVRIMQLLDLSTILPLVQERSIISEDDYAKIADTKHHGSIERTGYLLHSLYKQGQSAVDRFIQCLHETKDEIPNHGDILNLFEGGLPDLPTRPPLFEILDNSIDDIARLIEFTPFLKALLEDKAIAVTKFMDLQSAADRPIRDNLERLIHALEEKGSQGFVKFLSALQKEGGSLSHQELFGLLSEKVKAFFKTHPKRSEVAQRDKIQLLHMVSRDKLQEKRISEKFEEHQKRVEAEMQLPPLMPYLLKQQVLSGEEHLKLMEVVPDKRNRELVELLVKKGPQFLVRFVDCLEESSENKRLASLFAPAPAEPERLSQPLVSRILPDQLERHDKVAVMIQIEQYVEVTETYQLRDKPFGPKVAQIRGKLEQNLRSLGFTSVLYFKPSCEVDEEEEEGRGRQAGAESQPSKPKSLKDQFREKVGEQCKDGAVVFIFVSGEQFPFQDKPREETAKRLKTRGKFSAAILKDGASVTSRRESECIRAKDLHLWAESLPNAHVTFLFDTHQNHVAQFGKQRSAKVAEIMTDPWGELTTAHSNTVVYYLRPDPTSMGRIGREEQKREGEGEWNELGLLTECFVSALINCYKRADSELSHRQVYEAVSLYWHRRGRESSFFVPAVQGDVDREFLAKNVIPYHQFFRADLPTPVTSGTDHKYQFDLNKLQIPTGSMAGLIVNDQVEVYHMLCPSVKARGRITRAHQLDCTVEVVEGEEKRKLVEVLDAVYQDKELRSKDGSTEFLCVSKKYPLHRRFAVFTERLTTNDSETIKSYVKCEMVKSYVKSKSLLLTAATKRQEAALLVEPNGNYLLVKDLEGQVKLEAKARDAQHVKSFLEMMAWYKHALRLLSSSPTRPLSSEQRCHLNAERPLLSADPPLSDEIQFKWSSYVRATGDRQCHSAILRFTDPPSFWTPYAPPFDEHPCLEVEFKKNHVVTTIELRGDSNEDKFVKRADVWYQRDVLQRVIEWPKSGESRSHIIDLSSVEEAVRFVTIVPKRWDKSFTLTFRIKKRVMDGSTKKVVDLDSLTVVNWQFHQQRGTGWKCLPVPTDTGNVSLGSAVGWMNWSGTTGDTIMFDIGVRGAPLEKIEFTVLSEGNRLENFTLRMQTDWMKEPKQLTMMSAWPTKHEFQRPLLISNLQVWPMEISSPQPTQVQRSGPPPPSNIKLQMQLYGNKLGEPLEIEEGRILNFNFSNFTLNDLCVYIFCFEETGSVKFVGWDVAPHPHRTPPKSPLKKLLQAYIPQGYDYPSLLHIRDHYKVLVSKRKMYLEPFIQRGLHDYHQTCSYNVCSLGRRSDLGPDPWYEHNFEVIVKKAPRR